MILETQYLIICMIIKVFECQCMYCLICCKHSLYIQCTNLWGTTSVYKWVIHLKEIKITLQVMNTTLSDRLTKIITLHIFSPFDMNRDLVKKTDYSGPGICCFLLFLYCVFCRMSIRTTCLASFWDCIIVLIVLL